MTQFFDYDAQTQDDDLDSGLEAAARIGFESCRTIIEAIVDKEVKRLSIFAATQGCNAQRYREWHELLTTVKNLSWPDGPVS